MIEDKKKDICFNILMKFNENKNLNTQIVSINLKFYGNSEKELQEDEIGHANSVTIYKFKRNGVDSYLCLRTEPHRHTNIYCRNSVRKAIRDIFKYLPNSYYLDFIINSKEGLQINEQIDIQKENLSDFDVIPENIKNLSPLQGNSGFCASWTVYTLLLLMLNRNISLDKTGSYFATFNLNLNDKTKSQKFREEFDKCYGKNSSLKDSSCKSKDIFEKEFKKYIKYNDIERTYFIINENLIKYKYVLTKHIKLYRIIIFVLYFITKKLQISEIFDTINNKNDKNILTKIFNKFDNNKIMDIIDSKLKSTDSSIIDISDDILNRDTHKCDDNLYTHKEFCQINDIVKPFDTNNNFNCMNSKYKLEGESKIKLKGLTTTINEESSEQIKNNEETRNNIKYILEKIN